MYIFCDVRGEHAFCISSQLHSDSTELTQVYVQFKQQTCFTHVLSTESQFETPTKCLSIVSDPNKFCWKKIQTPAAMLPPPPLS